MPAEIVDQLELENQQVLTENRAMEFEYVFPGETGPTYWLTRKFPLVNTEAQKLLGVIGLDITERKQAEDALAESERLLNRTGEAAKVGGWEIDLEKHRVYFTRASNLIHEAPPDFTPTSDELLEFYEPEYQDLLRKVFKNALETGENYDLELPLTTLDGNRRWVRVMGIPEFQNDVCVRLWGTVQDITTLKDASDELLQYSLQLEGRVEERTRALQESEQRYRRLSDASQEAIFIHNNKTIVEVNQAFRDLFGYGDDEIVEQDLLMLTADEDKGYVRQQIDTRSVDDYEIVMQKKDGSKFPAWVSGRQIPIGGEQLRVITVRDLTLPKAMEEQLIETERLRTLGQLAGSVGHELRNPLGAIKNAAYFLNLMNESSVPEVHETIQIINREVDRSNKIIKELLDFTRVKAPKYVQVDIPRLLTDLLRETKDVKNIEIRTDFDDELKIIMADDYQLAQIFINLISNAIYAMPDGGQLTIETHKEGEDHIRIDVRDTGEGISDENRG